MPCWLKHLEKNRTSETCVFPSRRVWAELVPQIVAHNFFASVRIHSPEYLNTVIAPKMNISNTRARFLWRRCYHSIRCLETLLLHHCAVHAMAACQRRPGQFRSLGQRSPPLQTGMSSPWQTHFTRSLASQVRWRMNHPWNHQFTDIAGVAAHLWISNIYIWKFQVLVWFPMRGNNLCFSWEPCALRFFKHLPW